MTGGWPAFWLLQGAGDIRAVSPWLNRLAAAAHVSRGLAWTVVLALNFLVLAWLLYKAGFRGARSLPVVLRERGEALREQMRQAEAQHAAAAARLDEAERRLATLPAELEALRSELATEGEREYRRVADEMTREADRLREQARLEIESAAKLAQKELHAFAAALALDGAETRLRERLTPELDRELIAAGTAGLRRPAPKAN